MISSTATFDDDFCRITNCGILPLGYLLLLVDSYFDIRWVLWPSKRTETELRNYYTLILTPALRPLPSPGYWFPLYVIYKLTYQCPTMYNFILLGLFLPISYRYKGILNQCETERLQHWWTIVALRVCLAIVNTMALQVHGSWSWQHIPAFLIGSEFEL